MNNLKYLTLPLLLFSIASLASGDNCNDKLSARLKNSYIDGEPLSDLFIFSKIYERKIEIPFPTANMICKSLADNIFRVSLSADLPRGRFADYYFRSSNNDNISYIGGITTQASTTGVYRATGIYQIEKGDDTGSANVVSNEDKVFLSVIKSTPYTNNKISIRKLYLNGSSIEIDLLSRTSNQKICHDDETTIFYCKIKNGKILNLCYDPNLDRISYSFGDTNKIDIKLSEFDYSAGMYFFKNKGTSYIVSPNENKIRIKNEGKIIAKLQCFN